MKVKTPLALASQLLKNFAQDADNLEASSRLYSSRRGWIYRI